MSNFEKQNSQQWQTAFTKEAESIFTLIEKIEEKPLPFTSGMLASLSVEAFLDKEEDFEKWAYIVQDKSKLTTNIEINKEKLKVLFVTGVFPGTDHGGGLRIFDIILELAGKGHEVNLYSSDTGFVDGPAFSALQNTCKNINIVPAASFTQESLLVWLEENNYSFDLGYFVWAWVVNLFPATKDRINKIAFEYIECTVRRLWMDLLTKRIEDDRDIIKDILADFWVHYFCEARAAKEADILIAVTEKDSRFVKELYFDVNSLVSLTGVSQFEFSENKSTNNNFLPDSACFIGNYDHYPNLDGLIWYLDNVHEKIIKKISSYTFSIVGKGNGEKIEGLKNKYKHFSSSLQWIGPVERIDEALSKYTICLCPLISGAGLRGKVIQYSALKKSTVSTSIGVCGMPFVDGESIFISDEPEDFANKVIMLLNDTSLRDMISKNAFRITNDYFSWEIEIIKLEDYFKVGHK